jgi:hypothetical protein
VRPNNSVCVPFDSPLVTIRNENGCGTGKRLMLGTSGGVGRFATDVGCGEVFGSSDFWRERWMRYWQAIDAGNFRWSWKIRN